MGVREDRLRAEYNAMKKFRSEVVKWDTVGSSNPPSVYHITYNLTSIVAIENGNPKYHKGFKVKVKFPPGYPRTSPEVRLIEQPWPIHPNIWAQDGRFCLEGTQIWIPGIGVPLESVCHMVGEIIAFQVVNLDSVANNDPSLKHWIENNLIIVDIATVTNPVDCSTIRLPDREYYIRWGDESDTITSRSCPICRRNFEASSQIWKCSNCGTYVHLECLKHYDDKCPLCGRFNLKTER